MREIPFNYRHFYRGTFVKTVLVSSLTLNNYKSRYIVVFHLVSTKKVFYSKLKASLHTR